MGAIRESGQPQAFVIDCLEMEADLSVHDVVEYILDGEAVTGDRHNRDLAVSIRFQ